MAREDKTKEGLIEEIESLHKRIAELELLSGERKRAQEESKESEKRFMDVLYASEDAILLIDGNIFVDCNEATARLLGYPTREEFLMLHPSKLSPDTQPDGQSSFDKAEKMMKIASEKGFHRFEWMHRKASGEVFPVEVSLTPVMFHGKNMLHCVWRDITMQKQAEDSLRESEEKFRSIVDNIGIGVSLIGPDMEVLSLNNQMRKWNPQIDLKQKSICYRVFNNPPREESCSYCPTAKTLKDGEVHEAITETPMNGQIFNYRIISSPVRDSSGKVVAAIEMVEDITDRKKTEEALRESEERYRILFNGSHDALMTLDSPDFKFTSMNDAAKELFGIKDMTEFNVLYPWGISPETQPDGKSSVVKAREMLEIALRKGSCYFEWMHKRPNGEEFPCSVLLSVLTFGGKRIVQANVRDITETKKIENELKRKTEFLEAQKEASLDGLLVIDENGQRILINKRLIELWKVPEYIIEDKSDEVLLQYVVSKTKDPQQFLDKVNYLYAHKDEKSRDEVEFQDGMIFDRYSSPVIDKNGKYFGRIWTFRDITELKQAEQELKKDLHDLEVFYKASIGREERILELKKQIKELERKLGNTK